MNSFTFKELNADIPVIYIGLSVIVHVKCVIRRSGTKGVLLDISTCIVGKYSRNMEQHEHPNAVSVV
jgi:hypothetical protein